MSRSFKIGITDCGKFDNYRRWIEMEYGVEVIKLSMHLKNANEARNCDGLLFSGGEDLQPVLYGKPEYVEKFGLQEIIPERDRFEYEVLEKTFADGKPVLGICRGLQLINVYLGGTLVPDIPTIFAVRGAWEKKWSGSFSSNKSRARLPASSNLRPGAGLRQFRTSSVC